MLSEANVHTTEIIYIYIYIYINTNTKINAYQYTLMRI